MQILAETGQEALLACTEARETLTKLTAPLLKAYEARLERVVENGRGNCQ